MLYEHILVAVDGSNTSVLALQEAIKIAKYTHSKLRIIIVVDVRYPFAGDSHTNYDQLWSSCMDKGQEILDKMTEQAQEAKIDFESRLIEISPEERTSIDEKIVTEAINWPADLLIIGTHGRSGFKHLILGSVAEHVVRTAPIPVLLVKEKPAV